MCRLINSRSEKVSGIPVEYLNTILGPDIKKYRFLVTGWTKTDIQNECEKKALKSGYYHYQLRLCKNISCDDEIRNDVESRYFGIQTNFSKVDFKKLVGKIVSFHYLEDDPHRLILGIESFCCEDCCINSV